MDKIKGIAEYKSYGKVNITLSKLMDKYNISIYQMGKLTNLKYTTIKSYYNNTPITRVDLDVVAKMCYVLDCNIEDILEYTRPNN
jgi:putative transcriptional regulator